MLVYRGMNTLITALKSRTVWTLILMFVIGGVSSISSLFPAGTVEPILVVLGFVAAYFKLNPSQTYA
jgi:glycerol uptake facilitator-like aquaporin